MDHELESWIGTTSSALLVIDIQNDYIDPRGAIASAGRDTTAAIAMMAKLHQLIEAARAHGVPRYFIRNAHGPNTDSDAWRSRRVRTHQNAGQVGSWGAEWYEVEPQHDEVIVEKYRYDAFLRTPLELMLRAQHVDTVICCGTATNVCVESTARAAHMRDFNLVLVGDCCAGTNQRLHEATLENIRRSFGFVATSADVIGLWEYQGRRPV